jgi:hypothetical protein
MVTPTIKLNIVQNFNDTHDILKSGMKFTVKIDDK